MSVSIGVAISPSAVRVAIVERIGAPSRRTGAGPLGKLVAAREVRYDAANPAALTQALTQLRQTLRITQPVVLGLPSSATILATIQPLITNPQHAALAVEFELQQLLPFKPSDAVWHYQWLAVSNGHRAQQQASSRNTMEGMAPPATSVSRAGAIVAAMRRTMLEERLACCQRAGFSVRAIASNAVATFNVWDAQRPSARPAPGVLLSVVDRHTVEWIVWTPTQLHVVPLTVPSPDALDQELAASWQALQSQVSDALPKVVWVLNVSEELPNLQETLKTHIKAQVESFDATQVVAMPAAGGQPLEHFLAAVGLALQGLGLTRVNLNLIAEAQRRDHSQKAQRLAAVTSGVFAVAALGGGLSGMLEISHRRQAVYQALERREHLYQTLRPEARTLLQNQEHIVQRSRQLEQLVTTAPALTQLLGQLAEALPDDVWLTKLECTKGTLLEGQLEGRAKSYQSVTQLIEHLKGIAGMTMVKPLSTNVTTDEVSGKEMILFAIQLQAQASPTTSNKEKSAQAGSESASAAQVVVPVGRTTRKAESSGEKQESRTSTPPQTTSRPKKGNGVRTH